MFGTNFSGNCYGNYSYGALPPNNMGYFNYPSPYNQPQQNQNVNFQPTSVPQMTSKFSISPVASLDEAKSIQTPMDGSTMFLVNSSAGEIYSKTLAPNGGATFQIYIRKQETSKEADSELVKLQKRVDELERIIGQANKQPTTTKKVKGGSDE